MTSLRGKNVILKGWEKTGINDAIKMGTARLPSLDPFDEVDPMVRGRKEILDYDLIAALSINKDRLVEGCTTAKVMMTANGKTQMMTDAHLIYFMMMNDDE